MPQNDEWLARTNDGENGLIAVLIGFFTSRAEVHTAVAADLRKQVDTRQAWFPLYSQSWLRRVPFFDQVADQSGTMVCPQQASVPEADRFPSRVP